MILDDKQVRELADSTTDRMLRISGYATRDGAETPFNVAVSLHGLAISTAPAKVFEHRLIAAVRNLHRGLAENYAAEAERNAEV